MGIQGRFVKWLPIENSFLIRLEIFRLFWLIAENSTTPVSRGEPSSHRATVKYHPSKYFKHIAVVHSRQHFPYLRNLFESNTHYGNTINLL